MTQDIEDARIRILKETGYQAKLFAYPYGEYVPALAEVVRSLGLTGFGQHSGPVGRRSDFTALPRFPAGGVYVDTPRLATRLLTLPLHIKADPPGPLIPGRDEKRPGVYFWWSYLLMTPHPDGGWYQN